MLVFCIDVLLFLIYNVQICPKSASDLTAALEILEPIKETLETANAAGEIARTAIEITVAGKELEEIKEKSGHNADSSRQNADTSRQNADNWRENEDKSAQNADSSRQTADSWRHNTDNLGHNADTSRQHADNWKRNGNTREQTANNIGIDMTNENFYTAEQSSVHGGTDGYFKYLDSHRDRLNRQMGKSPVVREMYSASEFDLNKSFPVCPKRVSNNKFSTCYGPGTEQFFKVFPGFMRYQNCAPPIEGFAEYAAQIVKDSYVSHSMDIVIKRVQQCGYPCKLRAACCGDTRNFFHQGLMTKGCHMDTCTIDALNSRERKTLNVKNGCDLAEVGFPDWKAVLQSAALLGHNFAELNQRMLCAAFGTRRPRMNCVKKFSKIGSAKSAVDNSQHAPDGQKAGPQPEYDLDEEEEEDDDDEFWDDDDDDFDHEAFKRAYSLPDELVGEARHITFSNQGDVYVIIKNLYPQKSNGPESDSDEYVADYGGHFPSDDDQDPSLEQKIVHVKRIMEQDGKPEAKEKISVPKVEDQNLNSSQSKPEVTGTKVEKKDEENPEDDLADYEDAQKEFKKAFSVENIKIPESQDQNLNNSHSKPGIKVEKRDEEDPGDDLADYEDAQKEFKKAFSVENIKIPESEDQNLNSSQNVAGTKVEKKDEESPDDDLADYEDAQNEFKKAFSVENINIPELSKNDDDQKDEDDDLADYEDVNDAFKKAFSVENITIPIETDKNTDGSTDENDDSDYEDVNDEFKKAFSVENIKLPIPSRLTDYDIDRDFKDYEIEENEKDSKNESIQPAPQDQQDPTPPAQQSSAPLEQEGLPPLDQHSLPPLDQHSLPPLDQHSLPPLNQFSLPQLDQFNLPPLDQFSLPPLDQFSLPPLDQFSQPPMDQHSIPPLDQFSELPLEISQRLPPLDENTPPPVDQFSLPPQDQHSIPPLDQFSELPLEFSQSLPPLDENTPSPVDQFSESLPPLNKNTPSPIDQFSLPPLDQHSLPPLDQFSLPPLDQHSLPPLDQFVLPPLDQFSLPPLDQHSLPALDQLSQPPLDQHSIPPLDQHSLPPLDQHSIPPLDQHSLPPLDQHSIPPWEQFSELPLEFSQSLPPIDENTPSPVDQFSESLPPLNKNTPSLVDQFSQSLPPLEENTPSPLDQFSQSLPPLNQNTPSPLDQFSQSLPPMDENTPSPQNQFSQRVPPMDENTPSPQDQFSQSLPPLVENTPSPLDKNSPSPLNENTPSSLDQFSHSLSPLDENTQPALDENTPSQLDEYTPSQLDQFSHSLPPLVQHSEQPQHPLYIMQILKQDSDIKFLWKDAACSALSVAFNKTVGLAVIPVIKRALTNCATGGQEMFQQVQANIELIEEIEYTVCSAGAELLVKLSTNKVVVHAMKDRIALHCATGLMQSVKEAIKHCKEEDEQKVYGIFIHDLKQWFGQQDEIDQVCD